ncbi:hypothetical protein [Kitasatospora sp. NPDC088351]|uniref:hypothetical protein n=1 Tax=unclassified Kitasatospora TaxID=2633591 RepID=UPI00344823F5
MSGKPTRTELLAAALVLLASFGIAHGASALVDPGQPAVARLVWWLFFATALMTGMNVTEAWARRRSRRSRTRRPHPRASTSTRR